MPTTTIKDFIFGAGLNKEIIEEIQPNIDEHNLLHLQVFSSIAILFYGIMVGTSLFIPSVRNYFPLYSFGLVISIVCLLSHKLAIRDRKFLVAEMILFVSAMFLFGILSGTIYGPHESATIYVAFIFAVPLLYCIRPLYTFLILMASDIIFITLGVIYKDVKTIDSDIINVLVFSILSMVISTIAGRRQVNQFIMQKELDKAHEKQLARNKELEIHCNFDVMTGLENFYSYKALCHRFSETEIKKPVGVIFADLNRLKYVNDTEGHEAGNVYIKTFASKIKDNFEDFSKFRISGDEFLIINQDIDKESFIERAKKFDELIKSENIPTASIGYAFGTVYTIEEITTIAEQMMYDDKHLFYEKYPKFKRAIAEVQYQNEMNALVKVLTESYETLMLIDLEVDEYRVIKNRLRLFNSPSPQS